ncbi:MAG: hypothetical protein R3313_02365 [Candidatus Saccharimonadales bacterium]|nr:hypothetical protein [Candidatus Saccharimonadales bacterium]
MNNGQTTLQQRIDAGNSELRSVLAAYQAGELDPDQLPTLELPGALAVAVSTNGPLSFHGEHPPEGSNYMQVRVDSLVVDKEGGLVAERAGEFGVPLNGAAEVKFIADLGSPAG